MCYYMERFFMPKLASQYTPHNIELWNMMYLKYQRPPGLASHFGLYLGITDRNHYGLYHWIEDYA